MSAYGEFEDDFVGIVDVGKHDPAAKVDHFLSEGEGDDEKKGREMLHR